MGFSQLYIPVAAAYAAALLLRLMKKRRPALAALLTAFALHTTFLSARSFSFGFFNSGAILEEPAFIPFCLAGIGLWLWLIHKDEEAAALIPVAAVFALFYLLLPKGVIPPSAKSSSFLVPLFFFCEIMAHALFYAAATFACLRFKEKEFFAQAHRFAVWGFILYSAAQVSGAVWCYLGWSVPFQWGFRHLQSAAIWCFFANYIHLRFLPWWNSHRKAVYLLAGALLLATYLVILQFAEMGQLRIGG